MKINKLINEGIINPPTEPEIVFPGLILGAIFLPFRNDQPNKKYPWLQHKKELNEKSVLKSLLRIKHNKVSYKITMSLDNLYLKKR